MSGWVGPAVKRVLERDLFRLDSQDKPGLRYERIQPRLRDAFSEKDRTLGEDSAVFLMSPGKWKIQDGRKVYIVRSAEKSIP